MTQPALSVVQGGSSTQDKSKLYPFAPVFEQSLIHHLTTNPKFYSMIGNELEPGQFPTERAQVVVRLCQLIFKTTTRPPESTVQILQRIRSQVDEGKAALEDIIRVSDYLEECLSAAQGFSWQATLDEVVPIVRRRLERQAMTEGAAVFAKKGDLSVVEAMIQRARRIGTATATSAGNRLGKASFERIARLQQIQRLPFGIPELDIELKGGAARGSLTAISGRTGDGKSQLCCQVASNSLLTGMFVGCVTLELPEEEWEARVLANITGYTIDSIMAGGRDAEPSKAELVRLLPHLGTFSVQYMAGRNTTSQDVFDWVTKEENEVGRQMDVLIVDYADKMKAALRPKNPKDRNPATMGDVFDELRDFALVDKRVGWVFTPSQLKNKNTRTSKFVDADDLGGSSEKGHAIDLLINLRREDDGIYYEIPKNRQGRSRFTVGPFPHDEACARIYAPVVRYL